MDKFLQLNLNNSKTAQNLIIQLANEKDAGILVLSKPNKIPSQ